MVEWLPPSALTRSSFSSYVTEIQYLVSSILSNEVLLWTLVVLFILVLRWLVHPKSHVT